MCRMSISVWFVCKLCLNSFPQVDDFIEHKKEEHFAEFQNTSCIVFEETENEGLCPAIIKAETQPTDENVGPPIKIEVNEDDQNTSFSSEIIDDPNFDLVESKSELLTFECEIDPDNSNIFFGLTPPEQNPYVLLQRLTSEEIQSACVPQNHSKNLNLEQKTFANDLEDPSLSQFDSTTIYHMKDEKSTENQRTTIATSNSAEHVVQLKCNLCSKQLQSDAHLKIHVGICALYHKDRNRYCVKCNTKFSHQYSLKPHYLSHHGTEEEKLSLYKFRCHLCPKRYQRDMNLKGHLETHKEKNQQFKPLKSKPFKCSQPNCGKEFSNNSHLRRHSLTHSGFRPFSCSNCSKQFTQSHHLKGHLRTHTGERPYKCTVDSCNKAFSTSSNRSKHHRISHPN